MLVTIYTDAGQKGNQNVWAFRARSKDGWLSDVGQMDGHVKQTEIVEFEAVKQAAYSVIKYWPHATVLFFNLDNQTVLLSLWACNNIGGFKVGKHLRGKVDTLCYNMRLLSVEVRAKHVKAHTCRKDIRSYMNKTVDQMVRKTYK